MTDKPGHIVMPPPIKYEQVTVAVPVETVHEKTGKKAIAVDPTGKQSMVMNKDAHEESLRIAGLLHQLETNVQFCKNAGSDWLEVPEDVLKYFCKGKLPEAGYYIYKDIKLCLRDMSEIIAERERLDCHQIMFPDEGYMKIR